MIVLAPNAARHLLSGLSLAVALTLAAAPVALAKDKAHAATQKTDAKAGKGGDPNKAEQLGSFGEWGAYATNGKAKTCYALAQPKSREPAALKKETAYIFISTRPAENVKSELSFIMGFPMKDGSEAEVAIGDNSFSLIAKGANAWVKNPAEESRLIEAMKRGSKLTVKATSSKGKPVTDVYALAGLAQALEKVHKECR